VVMQFLDPLLIVVHYASTSFTVTPRGFRQLSSLTFFHTSEYILAIAIHGRFGLVSNDDHHRRNHQENSYHNSGEIVHTLDKRPTTRSITGYGVYRLMRHPSYCGFLFWSVGTQVMYAV
ncbi:hypothetical protein HID58_023280, partial [Brassica napus]